MSTDTKVQPLSHNVATLALAILNESRQAWEDYQDACDADRAQGYRPHYCRHGVNLWTDYDPICGACEDGWGWWNFPREARQAIDLAKRSHERFEEGFGHIMALHKMLGNDFDPLPLAKKLRDRYLVR